MTQRIIKFRAWDKITKKWVYFHIPNGSDKNDDYIDLRIGGNYEKFCQFTGLLDKNGKEIFEGDVVKTAEDGELVVEFRNGTFGVEIAEPSSTEEGTEYYERFVPLDYEQGYNLRISFDEKTLKESDVLEIIGNIYENPELLK